MLGLKKINSNSVKKIVEVLRQGGVVVFPTETAYGLAADATNAKAVRRVFAIKERIKEKSLPLIAADLQMVEKYAVLSPLIKKLVKKYWPGSLTTVVPIRRGTDLARGTMLYSTIAIRVSAHPIARELSKRLGRPIVSTSANLSGQPACYSVRAAKKQLGDRPDGYLDAGVLPRRKPSRIVTEKDGEIVVLRF